MTTALIFVFALGYLAIAFEHITKINKAAIALITAELSWTIYIISSDSGLVSKELGHHLSGISEILFFLLGAMTIVEIMDAHDGFDIITNRIKQSKKNSLLWLISIITFFLSAVLDNLTTTIVMISLTRKLIAGEKDRLMFAGMIVIAANAGGVWSPIGDVTTTMLWIGGQITALHTIKTLFVPSVICLTVPLLLLSLRTKGKAEKPAAGDITKQKLFNPAQQSIVFIAGILVLLFVPVFKTLTHLPPYMGMLGGLGFLWILTELIHGKKGEQTKHALSVATALRRIDAPSILFFLGILLSIAVLQSSHILEGFAKWISEKLHDDNMIGIAFGLISAVVDNVPLVAAAQGMFSMDQYPADHYFWQVLAYTTGTGGSALIIGSAAGVAAMGMEKISFTWYVKKFSLLALLGFFAGSFVLILMSNFI